MKRFLISLILVVLVLLLFAGCTPATGASNAPDWMWPSEASLPEEGGTTVSVGLEYGSWGNGTCYVYRMGSCQDTELIIPPVAPNGDRVVAIDAQAFAGYTELTSVTLPEGLLHIGKAAFSGCDRLATIYLPSSLRQIDERAFEDCKALSIIHLSAELVYIGEMAFDGCRRLKKVTFDAPMGWQGELGKNGWHTRLEQQVKIPSEMLSDPSSAADALKDTYVYYIWTRP